MPLLPTKRHSIMSSTSPHSSSFYHSPPHYEQGRPICDEDDHCGLSSTRYCHHPIYQQPTHSDKKADSVYQWRSYNDQSHSIPYSPPTQPYDFHSRQNSLSHHHQQYHHHHHQHQHQHQQSHYHYQYPSPTAMLSPPSAQLKLEQRRQSAEDKAISPLSPLSSTAIVLNHPQHRSPVMMTDWAYHQLPYTQQTTIRSPSPPSSTTAIRLPPLHTMVPSSNDKVETKRNRGKNDVGEVNAAVAMMQLSRHQLPEEDESQHRSPHLGVHPHYNQQSLPGQHQQNHYRQCQQHQHSYRHQHDQINNGMVLDPTRRASTGLLNRDSY
ncbi:hypothetical protein BC941DRAFT_70972 [Chlamydoabsidia padenii]|nr:hypothetical protein BC941DRAFT_70972 [Chlamydoabsidia padenii]